MTWAQFPLWPIGQAPSVYDGAAFGQHLFAIKNVAFTRTLLDQGAECPVGPEALREYCVRFLDAAAGGSVRVSAVEEMPATVQDALIELLAGLEFAGRPSAAVRLIAGTTVSLLDRIAAGTFSERLFYRLNIIHLMVGDNSPEVAIM